MSHVISFDDFKDFENQSVLASSSCGGSRKRLNMIIFIKDLELELSVKYSIIHPDGKVIYTNSLEDAINLYNKI